MAGKSKDQLDAAQKDREWWDAWWAEDYSWAGLAKKEWVGWFLRADGSVRGETGKVWPPRPEQLSPLQGETDPQDRGGSDAADSDPHPAAAPPTSPLQGEEAAPSVSPVVAGDPPPPLRGGGRPATLQDYWRRDPATGEVRTDEALLASGELVRAPDGALWHVVHMPVEWRVSRRAVLHRAAGEVSPQATEGAAQGSLSRPNESGLSRNAEGGEGEPVAAPYGSDLRPDPPTPLRGGGQGGQPLETWKSSLDHPHWARIEALVAARIGAGAKTDLELAQRGTEHYLRPRRDNRTLLEGAILRRIPAHPKGVGQAVQIVAKRAGILGDVDCRSGAFGNGADFAKAAFWGHAVFDRATFWGDASFDGATFRAPAFFQDVRFFRSARFEEASFQQAGFLGARFFGMTVFDGALFEAASFGRATFGEHSSFRRTSFSGKAEFTYVRFSSEADFEWATFAELAAFYATTFSGTARFNAASFEGPAKFRGATFTQEASFAGSAPSDMAGEVRQALSLKLEPACGDGAQAGEGALVTRAADGPLKRRSFRETDFSGAVFGGDVDFSNRSFFAATDFSGAVFGALAKFHDAKLHQDTNFTGADFRLPAHAPQKVGRGPAERAPTPAEGLALRDRHYATYERAFRTLKLAMEGHRARREEARFYRLELEARRKRPAVAIVGSGRTAAPSVGSADTSPASGGGLTATAAPSAYWARPPGLSREVEQGRKEVTQIEKGVSWLYGTVSGYGDSLWAPIGALLVLWLSFAVIYGALAGVYLESPAPVCAAMAAGANPGGAGAAEATAACPSLQTLLVFSGRHTFLPVMMTDADQAQWWFDATRSAPLVPFVAEFLHRLSAAVLIFLLALAVRRRFQIN